MTTAGTGYLVAPVSGSGPGVLVLHSWWGLTPFFRETCDRFADEGFVALARAAATAACCDGRPLAAAHAALPWPDA
ncbi:MAG TPA: dienelactone hydrolase family protein, partial [Acidimicrobiales bacterium]|nr:dienelactone hydrolase family protein [Acidimicrobiales bacterium]